MTWVTWTALAAVAALALAGLAVGVGKWLRGRRYDRELRRWDR